MYFSSIASPRKPRRPQEEVEDQRLVAGVKEANRSKQKLSAYPSDLSKYRELERVDLSWNFIKVGAWTRPSHSR